MTPVNERTIRAIDPAFTLSQGNDRVARSVPYRIAASISNAGRGRNAQNRREGCDLRFGATGQQHKAEAGGRHQTVLYIDHFLDSLLCSRGPIDLLPVT
jgi:hypothetical protein